MFIFLNIWTKKWPIIWPPSSGISKLAGATVGCTLNVGNKVNSSSLLVSRKGDTAGEASTSFLILPSVDASVGGTVTANLNDFLDGAGNTVEGGELLGTCTLPDLAGYVVGNSVFDGPSSCLLVEPAEEAGGTKGDSVVSSFLKLTPFFFAFS